MDDAIPIQKHVSRRPDGGSTSLFLVTAIALQTPEGRKLIPHPSGQEVASYATLEEAEQAISQAGFDAVLDGRRLSHARRAPAHVSRRGTNDPASAPFQALIELLLKALSDREAAVVSNAALALGELGEYADQAIISGLLSHLGDDDPGVRKAIAEALGKIGAPALAAMEDAYQQAARQRAEKNALHTRLTIVTAYLEMFHSHRELLFQIVPRLQTALVDDHWLIRSQAALAAGQAARLWQNGQLRKPSA